MVNMTVACVLISPPPPLSEQELVRYRGGSMYHLLDPLERHNTII